LEEINDNLIAFFKHVGKSGIPSGFDWEIVKNVILSKFNQIAKSYESERPISALPIVPNVDNYTFGEYSERITSCLNRFEDPPFTIGRICELLLEPRKHYDRGDKFLRAFEKCVAVTSSAISMENETNNNGVEVNNHSAEPHQNGTVHKEKMPTDHEAHKEVGDSNGHHHDSATNGTKTQDKVDNQVSSSEETTTTTDNSADHNNQVESSTDEKPEEDKQDDTVEGERVDSSKRSLEEPDTVAKKIARFENGDVKNDQPEEPSVEPTGETNGHGKDDAHIKATTGTDSAEIDQDVVGQGTAV